METRVSSKGQVVIPQAIRQALQFVAGTKLSVVQRNDEVVLRRVAIPQKRSAAETEALLATIRALKPYTGRALSIEEMDAAVAEGFRREWTKK